MNAEEEEKSFTENYVSISFFWLVEKKIHEKPARRLRSSLRSKLAELLLLLAFYLFILSGQLLWRIQSSSDAE